MKYIAILIVFFFAFSACTNDAESEIKSNSEQPSEVSNTGQSSKSEEISLGSKVETETSKLDLKETSPSKKELRKPNTLYESMDIEAYDFANSPFETENVKAELLNTAFIKIDTGIYANPLNGRLKDTMLYFYYDDQSEITLLMRGKEHKIVFAALTSNVLPLKNNVAMGMNKESFWSSFPNMDNVHRDFNILRVTNEDKMIWVGLQFQDDILKLLEYQGSDRN